MRNTITRSFTTVYANCTMYNTIDKKIYEHQTIVPTSCDTADKAEKYLRKNRKFCDKLVSVDSITTSTKLYGMEESTFIQIAKPISERGNATRNMITKTVNTLTGDFVYMDTSDRIVKSRPITIPANYSDRLDKYVKKVEKPGEAGILIENIKTVSAIYALSEDEFIRNAREMIDHQHYKE